LSDIVFSRSKTKLIMKKYANIYHEIRNDIKDGKYQIGHQLPDGKALATRFSCSEMTVKRALDILVDEGFITRKRGSGTFVKRQSQEMRFQHGSVSFSHLLGTTANLKRKGIDFETKLISFEVIPATATLANSMNIDVDDLIYRIKRVRIIENEPKTVEETFMPINRIPGLKKTHAETSVYTYIENELALKIHSSTLNLWVKTADLEDSLLLGIPVGEPMVLVSQTVYLDNGEIFEVSNVKHISESFNFTTHYVREKRNLVEPNND